MPPSPGHLGDRSLRSVAAGCVCVPAPSAAVCPTPARLLSSLSPSLAVLTPCFSLPLPSLPPSLIIPSRPAAPCRTVLRRTVPYRTVPVVPWRAVPAVPCRACRELGRAGVRPEPRPALQDCPAGPPPTPSLIICTWPGGAGGGQPSGPWRRRAATVTAAPL